MLDYRRNVRPASMARIETAEQARSFIGDAEEELASTIGGHMVLLAYSGGAASCVCAALLREAVGDRLTCVFVDHGLYRKDQPRLAAESFRNAFRSELEVIDATPQFHEALSRTSNPNQSSHIIGRGLVDLFERLAIERGASFIGLGTTHEDIVYSGRDVPSHHSVAHQPFGLKVGLVEPVRLLYVDELYPVGRELGLPELMVRRKQYGKRQESLR